MMYNKVQVNQKLGHQCYGVCFSKLHSLRGFPFQDFYDTVLKDCCQIQWACSTPCNATSEFAQDALKRDQTLHRAHHDHLVCKGPAMEHRVCHQTRNTRQHSANSLNEQSAVILLALIALKLSRWRWFVILSNHWHIGWTKHVGNQTATFLQQTL